MFGKKKSDKKGESTQDNDLDRPQTLAELDAMAREKKDDKVMLDDEESGGNSRDIEHEMTHSDELSADVDVKKVTKSQRKLWVLVTIASIMVLIAGIFFYIQLEDGGSVGIGAGGDGTVEDVVEDVPDGVTVPKGRHGYVAKAGQTSYKRYSFENESAEDIDVGAKIARRNYAFQMSSNSLVTAVDTGSGIFVKNIEVEHTFLSDRAVQISDWILIPDGTRVAALVNGSLHIYDTYTGEGGEVAPGFTPQGSDQSRLGYSRNGTLFKYAKSGGNLYAKIYDTVSGEVSELDRTVIRLDRMGSFNANSISPDGTSIVFIATINDLQTLQLLSLNSFVLRTVYVAEPGNQPTEFMWSDDSNNIAVYESGSSPRLSNLKVGTLEKEVAVESAGGMANLSWSPDKQFIGFVRGGKMQAVNLETNDVIDLIDSAGASDVTGWFQN